MAFDGFARELLLDYKFNRSLHLVSDLTDFLEGALNARFRPFEIDVVVPIPITLAHRWLRGYDQTSYLARTLAGRLRRRCDFLSLGRIGHPERQGGLTEEQRRENVRGTFVIRRPDMIRGRTILLVDDVMTTGSTFSEAAKTLKDAGASRVWCVSVVRSLRNL